MLFNFNSNITKKYDIYDFIACCVLGTSFLFALERTTYLDNAYLFFNLLNQKTFIIEHFRYSAFIPQIPALIAVKLSLSIGVVANMLSFGYLLVFFITFLIVKHHLKQKNLAIVFLACVLLAQHEVYFLMVSETLLALSIATLYAGWLLQPEKKALIYPILGILMIALGIFSHPIFAMFFVLIHAYLFIFNKKVDILFLIAFFVLFICKWWFFRSGGLEESIFAQLQNIENLRTSFLNEYMTGHLFGYYKFLIIVFISLLTMLLKHKLKRQFWFYIIAVILVYVILALSNADGDAHIMLQRTLYILNFAILFPLVFYWGKLPNQFIYNILTPIVLLMALNSINISAGKYTLRATHLVDKIRVLPPGQDKYIINNQQINGNVMLSDWALPQETAILSQWKLKRNITLKNIDSLENFKNTNSLFLNTYRSIELDQLNPVYFNFSKQNYAPITSTFILQ